MSTIRKSKFFAAMKFRTLKSAKFYSSEIKWINNVAVRLFNQT